MEGRGGWWGNGASYSSSPPAPAMMGEEGEVWEGKEEGVGERREGAEWGYGGKRSDRGCLNQQEWCDDERADEVFGETDERGLER